MSKEKQTRVLNRRGFLKTVTGAAAGAMALPYIVPSSVFGADGAVAPSNRLLVGVIGMGSQGGWDMRGFFSEDDSLVVAVCDVDKRRQKAGKMEVDQKYGNSDCKMYLDFREVIVRSDIDIISIAVPDHWHSIPAIMAAQAGKDIYGQKPMSRTVSEGRAICDAVKRYGVIWQTGSWQRSIYNFRRASELVINGRIGKVSRVEVGLPTGSTGNTNNAVQRVPDGVDWDFWLGPAPWVPFRGVLHWDWRWVMDYSGGQLTDWAGHHIDIAHWGLGLERTGPVEVEGHGSFPRDGFFNTPFAYKIVTKYANGIEMVIANEKQLPHGMGTCWYGDKGWLHVTRDQPLHTDKPSILDEVIGPNEIHLYESNNHHRNFLDCIKTRRETVTPAEIAHRSLTPALLGEIAMLTGRKLRWDPDKEVIIGDEEASKLLSRPMRSPWHLYM